MEDTDQERQVPANEGGNRKGKNKLSEAISSITGHFAKYIRVGLLFWLPLGITLVILKFLFDKGDNLIPFSIANAAVGRDIPGTNLAILILLLYLSGLFVVNTIGKPVARWFKDSFLPRIPFAGKVYANTKKVSDILTGQGDMAKQIVVFEPARLGIYKATLIMDDFDIEGDKLYPYHSVFVATSPMPNSGDTNWIPAEFCYYVYKKTAEAVIPLRLTKEELVKYQDQILKSLTSGDYMSYTISMGANFSETLVLFDKDGNKIIDPVHHTK